MSAAGAGFVLQIDDAWVPAQWDRSPDYDLAAYRRYAAANIEVLNHALDRGRRARLRPDLEALTGQIQGYLAPAEC